MAPIAAYYKEYPAYSLPDLSGISDGSDDRPRAAIRVGESASTTNRGQPLSSAFDFRRNMDLFKYRRSSLELLPYPIITTMLLASSKVMYLSG
jgi:hypothetical protein